MDAYTVAVGGVVLLPLIVGIIEALKRLFPGAPGRAWFGLSLLLGVAGWCATQLATAGVPADAAGWLSLVVLGLSFGLAAGKAYDEVLSHSEESAPWQGSEPVPSAHSGQAPSAAKEPAPSVPKGSDGQR